MNAERLERLIEYIQKDISTDEFCVISDEWTIPVYAVNAVNGLSYRAEDITAGTLRYNVFYQGKKGSEALAEFFGLSAQTIRELFYGESIYGERLTKHQLIEMIQEQLELED